MNAFSKRLTILGLWILLLAVLTLVAIGLHRALHGTKEDEQAYLMTGMLLAPILPMLCFRSRLLQALLAAAAALVCWFAFASGFFYYMDHHGSLPAEPCESKRVDFDEFECRGHYSFENELLVPQLGMAGLFGTAVGLGVVLARRRWERQ